MKPDLEAHIAHAERAARSAVVLGVLAFVLGCAGLVIPILTAYFHPGGTP